MRISECESKVSGLVNLHVSVIRNFALLSKAFA